MAAYYGERVVAGKLFDGYQQAFARFDLAVRQRDPDIAFFSLFESLNWAVAADDLIRELWRPGGEKLDFEWRKVAGGDELQDLLNGVRYARNLVHHHWANALESVEGATPPGPTPAAFLHLGLA